MASRATVVVVAVAALVVGMGLGSGAIQVGTTDGFTITIQPGAMLESGNNQSTTAPITTTASATTTERPGDTTSEATTVKSTTTREVTTTTSPPTATTSPTNRTRIERYIHRFVNQERAEHGLTNLSWSEELQEIARYHSEDMATAEYFSHTSPTGESMEDRYDKFSYDCRVPTGDRSYATGAENIATNYLYVRVDTSWGGTRYYDTAKELAYGIVQQWMHSEGHRKNILREYWRKEGIGVAIVEQSGNDVKVYATQNFC